jgi:small-conductance mechanosensitive channel
LDPTKEAFMTLFSAVNVGDSVQTGLDSFFGFLPKLLGFIIVLAIGWVIARVVRTLVTKALQKVGLDHALHSGTTGQYVDRVAPDTSPSQLIGKLAYWFIFLGALAIAVSQLGIAALDNFVAAIGAYLPNVIAAVLIFVVAGAIAAAVGGLVARTMGDTPTGKVVGSVVPVLVMAIATFMILDQLQIAPEIVTITYAALLGAAALAMALAFGLGGREVAGQMLSDAYRKGQEQRGQVRRDMEVGKERGKQDAQRAKNEAEARTGGADNGQTESTAAYRPSSS